MPLQFCLPTPANLPDILALNNAHAQELSVLTPESLARLIATACYVRMVNRVEAFCIALDNSASYDNPNFAWFSERFERFVYVDRIAVSEHARGRGLARALYLDLIDVAKAGGYATLCCEVNSDPPNPGSDAFHAALGFIEAGRAFLQDPGKTVRYLVRHL